MGAPRKTDRRVCAAAKGVFFKEAEIHSKGGPFEKCTVRVEISVNLKKKIFFCKNYEFFALKGLKSVGKMHCKGT